MPKSWLLSGLVIFISLFLVREIDQTNHFEVPQNFEEVEKTAFFNGQEIAVPNSLSLVPLPPRVLGDSTSERVIYVDLTNQMLYAYEGNNLIYSFLVSTGKWGRTPTGTFNIWSKFKAIKMSGGSKALRTYYYLPNVPYTMFFSNDSVPAARGFAIHGTYWHENFGQPMSHGCVNMKTSEAALIYNWSDPVVPEGKNSTKSNSDNPGTKVVIYGEAPKS